MKQDLSLTDDQIEAFHRDGLLMLRGVLSPDEVDRFRPIFCDYVMGRRQAMSAAEQRLGGSASKTVFTLGEAPRDVARFLLSPRLGEIAARLLGVDAVRFLHFCGFFKPGGGAPTPWHQDCSHIPLDTDKVLTIWVPLTAMTPDMGELVFARGSHVHGALSPEQARRFPLVRNGPMDPGDVSIHAGRMLHCAAGNTTDRMREVFAVSYYADGARIGFREKVPFMEALLEGCFAGLGPGELAAGPMNPIVYRREVPECESPAAADRVGRLAVGTANCTGSESGSGSAIGFDDLIAPVTRAAFFAEHWEKKPLVTRGRPAGFFAPLFSSKDVDRVICTQRPRPNRIEIVTSQGFVRDNYLNPDGTANVNLVYERYLEGSTIVLSGLDETWEPLARFSRKLEGALSHPVGIGLYLTPPGSQGVRPHFDTQEVFVLQVEGSKRWKVYEPAHELPAVEGAYRLVDESRLPVLVCETVLEPGDVLYLPRGFIHEAMAADAPSLHIALEVHVHSWFDLLSDALAAMADRERRLRMSLPIGFLHGQEAMAALEAQFDQLMDAFRRDARLEDAVAKHVEALAVKKPPPPDGHFAMLFAEIGPDTLLRKRETSLVRVFEAGGMAGIQFSGNQLVGPAAKIHEALEYIAEAESFTPAFLPGSLNVGEKLVLVKRLVRIGLLTRA